MRKLRWLATVVATVVAVTLIDAASQPIRANNGMVVSASGIASEVGAQVMKDGGNAAEDMLEGGVDRRQPDGGAAVR